MKKQNTVKKRLSETVQIIQNSVILSMQNTINNDEWQIECVVVDVRNIRWKQQQSMNK